MDRDVSAIASVIVDSRWVLHFDTAPLAGGAGLVVLDATVAGAARRLGEHPSAWWYWTPRSPAQRADWASTHRDLIAGKNPGHQLRIR